MSTYELYKSTRDLEDDELVPVKAIRLRFYIACAAALYRCDDARPGAFGYFTECQEENEKELKEWGD